MSEYKLFNFAEAAEYLGLHKQTLERHQRDERLVPDYQFTNGERVFTKDTLDEYARRWQSPMLTANEIQEMFGATREAFWYHFRKKRNIQHDAKRGRAECYSDSKVMMVARAEDWISHLDERRIGDKIIGLGFVPGREKHILYLRHANGEMDVVKVYESDARHLAEEALNQQALALSGHQTG